MPFIRKVRKVRGRLPHLSGLPHLPGVPHLNVNRPLIITDPCLHKIEHFPLLLPLLDLFIAFIYTLCDFLFHQVVINNTTRFDSTWILNGELTERSFLSDDLQQFCTDFPIYLLKKAQNSLAIIGIQEEGKIVARSFLVC